jgi:hypothetical protein
MEPRHHPGGLVQDLLIELHDTTYGEGVQGDPMEAINSIVDHLQQQDSPLRELYFTWVQTLKCRSCPLRTVRETVQDILLFRVAVPDDPFSNDFNSLVERSPFLETRLETEHLCAVCSKAHIDGCPACKDHYDLHPLKVEAADCAVCKALGNQADHDPPHYKKEQRTEADEHNAVRPGKVLARAHPRTSLAWHTHPFARRRGSDRLLISQVLFVQIPRSATGTLLQFPVRNIPLDDAMFPFSGHRRYSLVCIILADVHQLLDTASLVGHHLAYARRLHRWYRCDDGTGCCPPSHLCDSRMRVRLPRAHRRYSSRAHPRRTCQHKK